MTHHIHFLINCCKTNPTATEIEQICGYIKLNQNKLSAIIKLAHQHGVFPIVYQSLLKYASDLLAQKHRSELKQQNLNIVMQNMRMTAELIRIIGQFKENNIQCLAFKGPALSQLAYGDITLRQYGDLDILIKKQDIGKSLTLLTTDGYIPEITLSEETQEMFFACTNVLGLEKEIRIEIHWELTSKNYAINWQEAVHWQSNDSVIINRHPVPMLLYHTHLLYLCAHGSKHLYERLEWVCDIDRFIKANPALSWPILLADAQSKGIERMLLLGLYLCHKLLALSLPKNISTLVMNDPTVEKLGDHIIQRHFSSSSKPGKSYGTFWLLWQMRENYSDRLQFAYKGLFAPKFDDFKYIDLPRPLLPLYPIIRVFRLAIKYLQKK